MGMHPACMHVNTCTYIPQHTSTLMYSKVHKFMVMAETSTFGILYGRNVRGRNVLAEMSVAEMSVAEISYIRLKYGKVCVCLNVSIIRKKNHIMFLFNRFTFSRLTVIKGKMVKIIFTILTLNRQKTLDWFITVDCR